MKIFSTSTNVLAAMLLMGAISLVACQKDNSSSTTVDNATFAATSSQSDAEATVVFDDVFDNVVGTNDQVGMSGVGTLSTAANTAVKAELGTNGVDSSVTHCYTVTVKSMDSSSFFPVQVTIDFGSGCTGKDGRTRAGKIITVYTNRLVVPGAKATTTFEGYSVNQIQISGTHIIENQSTQNNRVFHVQVVDAKLTHANGNYNDWSSDKVITQTAGLGTPYWPMDDEFSITGQANGTAVRGANTIQWAHIITNPLIKKFTCHWFVQGTVTIQRGTKPVAILDFGNGDCDNQATVTVNGVTTEITLH